MQTNRFYNEYIQWVLNFKVKILLNTRGYKKKHFLRLEKVL